MAARHFPYGRNTPTNPPTMPASSSNPAPTSFSTRHSSSTHRHRHHYNNYPPRSYTDLTTSDISLLAPIFGPLPPRTLSIHAAHTTAHRAQISNLPAHLLVKPRYSILNYFCTVHKHLAPSPVNSVLDFVRDEVSTEALRDWDPVIGKCWLDPDTLGLLQEMNAVWYSVEKFTATFGRAPQTSRTRWVYQDGKCSACKLIAVAANVPGMIALAGCLVARISPRLWGRSKRVRWLEAWLRGSVEWSFQGEGVVRAMWECAVRLRRTMRAVTGDERRWGEGRSGERRREGDEERKYVEDFVAKVREPIRPGREAGQEDHVAWVEGTKMKGEVQNPMNPFMGRRRSGRASQREMRLPDVELPGSRPAGMKPSKYKAPVEEESSMPARHVSARKPIPPPKDTPRPPTLPPPPKLPTPPSSKRKSEDHIPRTRRLDSLGFFARAQSIHNHSTPEQSTTDSPPPHLSPTPLQSLQSPPASSDSSTGLFPAPLNPHQHRQSSSRNPYPTITPPRKRVTSSIYSRATNDPSFNSPVEHDDPFSPSFEFSDIEEEEDDHFDHQMKDEWAAEDSDWNAEARRAAASAAGAGSGEEMRADGGGNWWETVNEWRESEFIDSYRDRGEDLGEAEGGMRGGKGKGVVGRGFI